MSEKKNLPERPASPLGALDLDLDAFGAEPSPLDAPVPARAPREPSGEVWRATASSAARTHFAESVGRSRPAFDSEPPEPLPTGEGEEPVDLPEIGRERVRTPALKALLRSALRGAAEGADDFRRKIRSARQARLSQTKGTSPPSPVEAKPRRRTPRKPWPATGPFARYREPALGLASIALVYAATTTALGTAPWSGGSQVPDLGPSTESPRSEALPEPRDFRVSAGGKPVSSPKNAPQASAAFAPSVAEGPVVEVTALPSDLSFPGKSLLEVVTAEDELIYVDGVFIGRGPLRRMPVPPGAHLISIRSGGTERKGTLDAAAGRLVRASFIDGSAFAAATP